MKIGHDAVIGDSEYRRIAVRVNGNNGIGVFHARDMLDRARDPAGDIEPGTHRLACLPYLMGTRYPACFDDIACGSDLTAQYAGQFFNDLKFFRRAHTPAAGDDNIGRRQIGTPLTRLDHFQNPDHDALGVDIR